MRASRRGFTLIEMVVVVAIIAVVIAIAVYNLYGAQKGQDVRRESKVMVSALREARLMATSNPAVPGLVCATPPCIPRTIGIRIVSRTSYDVFGDMDALPGGEAVIQTVDLHANHPDNQVQFTTPPDGTIYRFATTGSMVGATPPITMVDTVTGEAHVITLTLAGLVAVN